MPKMVFLGLFATDLAGIFGLLTATEGAFSGPRKKISKKIGIFQKKPKKVYFFQTHRRFLKIFKKF